MAKENMILTEAQLMSLERKKERRESFGEIETEHPGYLGSQDTYYVGNIKGVSRIYQQTFIDTYTLVAFAKLYESKHAITSADILFKSLDCISGITFFRKIFICNSKSFSFIFINGN